MQSIVIDGTILESGNATAGRGFESYSYVLFKTKDGEEIRVPGLIVRDDLTHHLEADAEGRFVVVKNNGARRLVAVETAQGSAVDPHVSRSSDSVHPFIWVMIASGVLILPLMLFIGFPILALGVLMLIMDKRSKRQIKSTIKDAGFSMQAARQF